LNPLLAGSWFLLMYCAIANFVSSGLLRSVFLAKALSTCSVVRIDVRSMPSRSISRSVACMSSMAW